MTSTTPWRSAHRQTHDRGDKRVFQVRNRPSQNETGIDLASAPEIVGYFSLDGNRTYLPDASNLTYYNPPKTEDVSFDLNKGIENVRRKPASANDEKISNLLKWITLNNDKIQAPIESSTRPNFVCFRGLLRLLLCTPYSPKDPWIICAAKWKGTIYLCEFKTPEEKRRNANMSNDMLKFMSWGFKFEKYILSDAPDQRPDSSQPVDECEEFCCMFKRRIGDHTILFGAEMDGVLSKTKLNDPLPLKELQFVELKTNKTIEHAGQDRNFRKFKLLKWWSQSWLVGIEKILCGFRDDNGIVDDLRTYSLAEIIEMSKQYWNAKTCLDFLESFLTHVSDTVVNDCDKIIYKFERIPFENIVTSNESPLGEYAFIEPSYLDGIK